MAVTPGRHATAVRIAAGVVLTALFVAIIVRYAWVAEDAYITLRTVDNLVHGFGARWNVAERVQSYTHPLWMLLLAAVYAVTREGFVTTIVACVTLSAAAFALVQRLAVSTVQAVLCGALLLLSPAFVDFSTSGLENALSHLLVALFAFVAVERTGDERALRRLSFVAALCLVNRLDLAILVAPAIAWQATRTAGGWRTRAAQLAAGAWPLVAWEAFSLAYYGFLFPNTAYAKLATGVSAGESWRQGLAYLGSHVSADPLTLLVLVAGVGVGLAGRDAMLRALGAGVALYVVYLVRVGGDFMLGRFLTPPFVVATIVLGRSAWLRARPLRALPLGAALVAVGLSASRAPLRAPLQPKPPVDAHGVADERLVYAEHASLAARRPGVVLPDHHWAEQGRALAQKGRAEVVVTTNVGFLGYFAGPRIHIIDANALTDPLLARLPIAPGHWRIGHFTRAIPDGYVASVESGKNRLTDARVARLYDDVVVVTRGPLFRWQRLLAMVRLALAAR